MEMNYASNGKGNLGVTLGAIGTGLAAMNGGAGGILGNLFGNGGCGENAYINRYEAGQQARISELETEVKLRDANFYSLSEVGKLRDYMEHRFDKVEHELADQRVYNAVNTTTLGCVKNDVEALKALTKVVIPAANICPAPMPQYNSWTAPTTTTTTG